MKKFLGPLVLFVIYFLTTVNSSAVKIGKIYNILGNKELSKKLLDSNLRLQAVNSLKDELSGIYRKNQSEK